jgi:hypothetical protein
MHRVLSLEVLAIASCLSAVVCSDARAENETPGHLEGTKIAHEEGENDYATKGTWEMGGGFDFSWTRASYDIGFGPQLGYFIADRVEISLLAEVDYENVKLPGGDREGAWFADIVIEPSYHHPLTESLFIFAGLGVGLGYDFNHPQFDLKPRAGFNIEVGRSGIFTPAVEVPLFMGKNHGPTDDEFGVDVGVDVGAAYTTTF